MRNAAMPLDRRTVLTSLSAAFGSALVGTAPAIASEEQTWATIDAIANSVVEARHTPGLSISVVKNGQMLFSAGYGHANLETMIGVQADTVFKIASVTKHMVAVALLRLEEEGVLALSDLLSRFVPEFPNADQVTLHQIAAHTAGYGSYSRLPTRSMDQRLVYNSDQYLDLLLKTDPMTAAQPGAAYAYSNTGYGILGVVIERATEKPFAEVLGELIFTPYDMARTFISNEREIVRNRAAGYSNRNAMDQGFVRASLITSSYVGAAGAVESTTEDLALWHNRLITGKVLSPASFSKLIAPIQTEGGETQNCLAGGLSTSVDGLDGLRVITQGGRLNGFSSHLWSFPDQAVSVACLFNSDGGDNQQFGQAFDSVRNPATRLAVV